MSCIGPPRERNIVRDGVTQGFGAAARLVEEKMQVGDLVTEPGRAVVRASVSSHVSWTLLGGVSGPG